MKSRLLSFLVLYCFLASSIAATSVVVPQTQESMRNYIIILEKQLELSKTVIVELEKRLMSLENYKNNLNSYNLSTTKLTEKEKKTLEEEKLLRKSLETLTQQLEMRLQELTTQLIISTENLKKLETQLTEAKELYTTLYGENEKEKKKTKLWQILSVVSFLVGGFIGLQAS